MIAAKALFFRILGAFLLLYGIGYVALTIHLNNRRQLFNLPPMTWKEFISPAVLLLIAVGLILLRKSAALMLFVVTITGAICCVVWATKDDGNVVATAFLVVCVLFQLGFAVAIVFCRHALRGW